MCGKFNLISQCGAFLFMSCNDIIITMQINAISKPLLSALPQWMRMISHEVFRLKIMCMYIMKLTSVFTGGITQTSLCWYVQEYLINHWWVNRSNTNSNWFSKCIYTSTTKIQYNPNGEVNLVKSAQHLAVELKYIY